MREKPPDLNLGIDLQGNFNFLFLLTTFLATMVRPIFLGHNGTRAYGFDALAVFVTLPVVGTLVESAEVIAYWQLWTVMLVIRRLLADRRQITTYWGHSLLRCVTRFHRFFEPLLVALCAFLIGPYSLPLGRVFWAGAFSLAFQYRVGAEMARRQREAVEDAMKTSPYYL